MHPVHWKKVAKRKFSIFFLPIDRLTNIPRHTNTAVNLERNAMHSLRMALLMQHFLLLFQIPQSPRRIITSCAQESTGRMERQPWHTMRNVARYVCYGFFTTKRPKFHCSIRSTGCHCHNVRVVATDSVAHGNATNVSNVTAKCLDESAVGYRPHLAHAGPVNDGRKVWGYRNRQNRSARTYQLDVSNNEDVSLKQQLLIGRVSPTWLHSRASDWIFFCSSTIRPAFVALGSSSNWRAFSSRSFARGNE